MFHRSAGTSETASTPLARSSQNASGPCALPGNRQPIPIIAMGSLRDMSIPFQRRSNTSADNKAALFPAFEAIRNGANRIGLWSHGASAVIDRRYKNTLLQCVDFDDGDAG